MSKNPGDGQTLPTWEKQEADNRRSTNRAIAVTSGGVSLILAAGLAASLLKGGDSGEHAPAAPTTDPAATASGTAVPEGEQPLTTPPPAPSMHQEG